MEYRIAKAWSSLHSVQKIWKALIRKHTKPTCLQNVLLTLTLTLKTLTAHVQKAALFLFVVFFTVSISTTNLT